MIACDPSLPLIGLHLPKCAGQSMQQVLRSWFGSQPLEYAIYHYALEHYRDDRTV